jgi:hypothetical protein
MPRDLHEYLHAARSRVIPVQPLRTPDEPCYADRMAIAVQVHDNDPQALAELIAATIHDVVMDREPNVAHLSALVANEEREADRRRAAWRWLNSISSSSFDRDNDWSDV